MKIHLNTKQIYVLTILSPIVLPCMLIGFTVALLWDSCLAGKNYYDVFSTWLTDD